MDEKQRRNTFTIPVTIPVNDQAANFIMEYPTLKRIVLTVTIFLLKFAG